MYGVPSVCIMIPSYNQANYIVKAVESALAQDYCAIEIVVADDNSTDNTEELIQPLLANPKIKYIKNSSNLGRVGNYRNCLYNHATADWVINLDGDDYFTNPRFISHAMQTIKSNEINNILFYQGTHILKFGALEKVTAPQMSCEEDCITTKDYFFKYFERNYFSHMSTLYCRQLAIENNFYQSDILSTDIFSFLQLCLKFDKKKVIVSKNIAGVWLQHDTNASKTIALRPHWDNFKLYLKLYHLAIKNRYNKLECFKWLLTASYNYVIVYIFKLIAMLRPKN